MKTVFISSIAMVAMILCGSCLFAETIDSRVGALEFRAGYPTEQAVETLYDELDFQRAVQAYLWALPMASYGAMADAHKALGANSHTVVIADKLAQPWNVALTANQDTVLRKNLDPWRCGKNKVNKVLSGASGAVLFTVLSG